MLLILQYTYVHSYIVVLPVVIFIIVDFNICPLLLTNVEGSLIIKIF